VQRDAECIRRRFAEFRGDVAIDVRDAAVRCENVPVPVDDQRRIWLMRNQEPSQRLPDGHHLTLVQRALAEDVGEAGRQKQSVAFAERNIEAVGKMQDHLSAGPSTPVSMKLRCRADTADRRATSSWLRFRRSRRSRSSVPTERAASGTAMPGP
jgi:hypothetical protein